MGVSTEEKTTRRGRPGLLGLWPQKLPEHLALRLEFNGRIIHETAELSRVETLTIGRSSDCTWVIPREDNVASGHHAVILMRKGRFCLRDTGSRNGIFYKSRRIQEKNLAPGDQFAIGNCTLFVEKVKSVVASPHEVVYLNTAKKGTAVRLHKARIVAGSAPGCDLVIDEQLVSQRHAEFCTKADGCWLRDLGSKNGTFVNGTKLSANTERLLVDDDVVSISFVDFKFVDGKVEHSRIRIWYSLGVVAVTVFIVLVLNWLLLGVRSSSDTCLNQARQAAAAAHFARARELLRESRTRRGAENNEIACNELEQSIAVWEKVSANWIKAKSTLNAGDWVGASHILGMITEADPNLWGWNAVTAPEMRKEAFAAKKLLDAFLRAETALRDDRNRENPAELKNAADDIRNMEQFFGRTPPPYVGKLLSAAGTLRRQIDRNLLYLDKLAGILGRLESEAENLALVLRDLEELKQDAGNAIRIRIENCMTPLAMLQRSGKEVKRGLLQLQALDFAGLEKIRLELPALEQCAVNARIATLRKNQERHFEALLAMAANLKPLVRSLDEAGLSAEGDLPACVLVFGNGPVMKKVLACDALERRMPSRLREQPAGDYDRLLGIEGFFEYMYALPAPYDQAVYAEGRFLPEIVKFRRLLGTIRTFRTFMEQPGHGGLLSGDLGRLYERTGEVLASRDKLTAGFASAKGGSPRERVLLKAMVLFLREERAGEGELEDFTRELKQMRMPLIRLGREYNSAPDEKKIEIRDSILRQGLPGDPVVRRMWGFKKYPR